MNEKILELLVQLKNEDAADRRYAAEDLADFRVPQVIEALGLALDDRDTSVREAIVDSLIKIGGSATAETMMQFLSSESTVLRNHAVEILERLDEADLNCLITDVLRSPDPDVRKFGLDVLANRPSFAFLLIHDWFHAVADLLDDPNANVASAAAEILGKSGRKDALKYLLYHVYDSPWMQMVAIEAIASFSDPEGLTALKRIDPTRLDPSMQRHLKSLLLQMERIAS